MAPSSTASRRVASLVRATSFGEDEVRVRPVAVAAHAAPEPGTRWASPNRCAWFTRIVFALGRSSPASMIAVHRRMSARRAVKSSMATERVSSSICPCPTAIRASGSSSRRYRSIAGRVCTRLWTKKTCPPRRISRSTASGSSRPRRGRRRCGSRAGPRGVAIRLTSRIGERHVQRARDRRGRQRQHVDGGAHSLQPLLVRHSEPLLLVDHHEPEVPERHVPLQQPVRTDDDVHRAVRHPLHHLRLVLPGAEPRQVRHPHGGTPRGGG